MQKDCQFKSNVGNLEAPQDFSSSLQAGEGIQ